jgi:hypothetical protein
MTEMLHQLNSMTFLVNSCFTAGCLSCNQRALVDESGVDEVRWGRTIDQKWPQIFGCFVGYHPVTVTSMYTTHNEMLKYKDMAAGIFQNIMMFSAREES